MRKQLLGVFLPLIALMLLAAAAETQSTGTGATKRAALQRLDITRGEDGISIELTAQGQMNPKLSTLDRPARVVLDLPATVAATNQRQFTIDSDVVKGVRVGMDDQTPPTTRVVVDLAKACPYELVPSGENKLILKLHPVATAVAQSTPKSSPVALKPVRTPAAAAKPAVVKSEMAAAKPAPVIAPVESKKSSATDFVFVEPSYKPKDQAAEISPVIAPPARAMEAASKFADKPASELVNTSAHAAMQPQAAQAGSAGTVAIQPAVNLAAEQKAQSQQSPAGTGAKYTGEPISVNLKDVDLKDFFRLIHEISGLNVVLDPNVHGSLTIVLDDVPWDQALDIVLKNNELARERDGNVLRVATRETLKKAADSRRAQQEAQMMAVEKVTVTRFLSYAHSKDVVSTVKKFLTQRGDVISDDRTNAVIISDIPTVMPQIDRLLTQLDRKTQEVEIEARVVAATRSFARDIGTQLGFGWGNGHTAIGGANAVGTSPTNVNGLNPGYITVGGSGTTAGTQIPLFSNLPVTGPTSGLTFVNASNNVRIDTILTLAESRGLLKILSRPRVVTQNNIQALVRQGVRVPIVTQAQLGGPPTVSYVDAFLRLTVIPQITS